MHSISDFRSDTVTRPTPAMRLAMLDVDVGDNVYGEDPTILKLEERVARLLGKEAALYVATGTMANTLAIRLCVEPGDEIVLEASAHPIWYEAGGSGAFSGVMFKPVVGKNGILAPADLEAALYEPIYYRPRQKAVLVENTSNRGGGTIYPLETLQALGEIAHGHGLRAHLDGARLWNASVATGVSMAKLVAPFDTACVCFSKGLGAPVGSCLVGSRKDIERAWHYRHMLGGSWRQAGLLAACALYALDHNVERLAEDHVVARQLAEGLQKLGLPVLNEVETNMVYWQHPEMSRLLAELRASGVLASEVRPGVARCVTHMDVGPEDVKRMMDLLTKRV